MRAPALYARALCALAALARITDAGVPDRATAAPDPVAAVAGLITRLLGPAYLPVFALEGIPADAASGRDVFEIASGPSGGPARVTLRGNTGVSLASALGWYLKFTCNASFTWGRDGSGNQLRSVPPPAAVPVPEAPARHVKTVEHVYSYNVVTFGYTTAFWDAAQWTAEIDRLALWGVDLPLAFVGQEAAWLRFWVNEGLRADDVLSYFSGPAFLPWQVSGRAACECLRVGWQCVGLACGLDLPHPYPFPPTSRTHSAWVT